MGETLALLDLGSHAVRFVLAKLDARPGFEVIVEERVPTRLGSSPDRLLPQRAIDATLLSATHFLERVSRKSPRVLVIATSAVREAPNQSLLLDALAALAPAEIRILTGPEEARLGAEASLASLPVSEGTIVDLGGGSMELSRVKEGRVVSAASLPLGCVRLTRRFLHGDPPSTNQIRSVRDEMRALLPACHGSRGAGPLVVLGGTVRALARLHHPRRTASTHGMELGAIDVTRVREWLERTTVHERRELPGLKPDRADVLLAGVIALEELLLHGRHRKLVVSSASVRQGVLFREAVRHARVAASGARERVPNRTLPPGGFEPLGSVAR